MTLARTTTGINKAEDSGTTHVDQVHRCFTADLADEADQLSRTSWLDTQGDLVRPEFSNISFEATRVSSSRSAGTNWFSTGRGDR